MTEEFHYHLTFGNLFKINYSVGDLKEAIELATVYIVWCIFACHEVSFISVWDDREKADREAESLNARDPVAHYFVSEEAVNSTLQ
jgi:hypothetical protein